MHRAGNKSEQRQRLLEAAVAVLQAVPGRKLNAVVLNKALFYLDLIALRDLGHPITGSAYVALQNGPVVAKYKKRLIQALKDEGLAEQLDAGPAKPIRLKTAPETFAFVGDRERELVAEIAQGVGRFTSTRASDFSHDNPGWQMAQETGKMRGHPAPIDMFIAMQQVLDDDPWLSEKLDDETRAIAERADRAELEW